MIKGIIFDMGHTLLRFQGDWESVIQAGAEAMASWYFKQKHIKLDQASLVDGFIREREAGRVVAAQTQQEVLAEQSLVDTLKKMEAPASALALVKPAIKVFFEPEEKLWERYPDALDTLKLLAQQGYRLGLYSNATDDPLVQRLMNRNGFRPWLSPTFSSAGCGWLKPRPEPFQLIAQRWNLAPAEMVMVGDTLEADILGAQNAGMAGILVTMDEAASNADNRHIQPAAVAERLAALPEIIPQLGFS